MLSPYRNESFFDFSMEPAASAMRAALAQVEGMLGRRYPAVIGGERIEGAGEIVSVNPACTAQVVGAVTAATVEQAEMAVRTAASAFESWRHVDASVRARYLLKAAAIIRRRRMEFAAWLVFEVSKSWVEADVEVAEAIDFLELYAREALRLSGPQPTTPLPGEQNELTWIPLGVGAVIPPWNFPLAIMAGMTAAAVVSGNTVVLKPASAAPVVCAKFAEVLEEASLPAGVVNYLPGSGSRIGDALTDSILTRFIAFTGSREIGVRIFGRAATVHPGQKWLKRTVLEMGGKDAIVVDDEADVDAAAEGVAASAFGYQGQKCSACSRLIVLPGVKEELLAKVIARASSMKVGNPTAGPDVFMGAVIDASAQRKGFEYIEIGRAEGRIVWQGETPTGGTFVTPTIVDGIAPDARLAQEEVFGPVLAVIDARDYDHAIEIANGTDYGLTGAVFSRNRRKLEQARAEFAAGNLYLNRKCTGALVDAQPFGGFNMSGTDSKAGGREYLQLFMQQKLVGERL